MPVISAPVLGISALLSGNQLDARAASKFSQNVLYENGIIRTRDGFARLDLNAGLDSGQVLTVFPFREVDGYDHMMAVTNTKIYDHDNYNLTWVNKTNSSYTGTSVLETPVSYAVIGHQDAVNLDGGSTAAYHHLIVCDGGLNNIQRWAGRNESMFYNLVGGGGYHDGTTHRAKQVSVSQKNRLLLLSPLYYVTSSGLWVEQNQEVRWPVIGKVETWTGTGSGFVKMYDTGGTNLWAAPLGDQHIIYQTQGIWTLNYVGGTTVFSPYPYISDLGLYSPHALVVWDNVHYFLGTDLNVYAYYGGSAKKAVGDSIQPFLQEDVDYTYQARPWMTVGPNGKFLWLFIVPFNSSYITKAYCMNLQTGAWQIHDFQDKFSTGGITAASLMGSQTFGVGDSYTTVLGKDSTYLADDSQQTASEVTIRYGDVMCGTLLEGTVTLIDWTEVDEFCDFTKAEFSKGGLLFCLSAASDSSITRFKNKILQVRDGSESTNMPYGVHYYTIGDISPTLTGAGEYSVKFNILPRDTTANAMSDASNDIPILNPAAGDTSAQMFDPTKDVTDIYFNMITYSQSQPRLVIGDATGFVYVFGTELEDDVIDFNSRHITPIFDYQQPDLWKRWQGIAVTAKGTLVKVSYRTSGFNDATSEWTTIASQDLSSDYEETTFYLNATAKRIQFRFDNTIGTDFQIREFKILDPLMESDR